MPRFRSLQIVIPLAAIALFACIYFFGCARPPAFSSTGERTTSQIGKYQLISGREEWYEGNVPVVHEAVLMLDTETGQIWKLTDIYGAKKWEPIDPPKSLE